MGQIAVICAALGTIFLAIGVGFGVASLSFVSGAEHAEGTVIRMVRSGSKGGSSPVVRYEVDGRAYTIQSTISSSASAYSVGEKVQIVYKPDNPARGHIDSFLDRWAISICFGGIGLLFATIGFGILMARLRRRKKAHSRVGNL
jgi:hypothetical protein